MKNPRRITTVPDDLWRIPAEVDDIKTKITLDDVRKSLEAERHEWIELNGVSPEIMDVLRAMTLVMDRLRENHTL